MSQPFDPLIGCPVSLVSGDFAGYTGVVRKHDLLCGAYIIEATHPVTGAKFPIAAHLHEFRPLSMGPAVDPDTPLAEEQRAAGLLPPVPKFGMTRQMAAQYTAQFVAGVAQVAHTFESEGGYLTFEPMDLTELLEDFQLSLMEISAFVSAMSVRVARLYAAIKESE